MKVKDLPEEQLVKGLRIVRRFIAIITENIQHLEVVEQPATVLDVVTFNTLCAVEFDHMPGFKCPVDLSDPDWEVLEN